MLRMTKLKRNGLDDCIEAFERLKTGNPIKTEHIGLSRAKFSAGKISWEAGKDRGYLKKNRPKHAQLIGDIEKYAKGISSAEDKLEQVTRKSDKKVEEEKKKADLSEELLHLALSRELLLVSKIKELEQKVKMLESPLGRIKIY